MRFVKIIDMESAPVMSSVMAGLFIDLQYSNSKIYLPPLQCPFEYPLTI